MRFFEGSCWLDPSSRLVLGLWSRSMETRDWASATDSLQSADGGEFSELWFLVVWGAVFWPGEGLWWLRCWWVCDELFWLIDSGTSSCSAKLMNPRRRTWENLMNESWTPMDDAPRSSFLLPHFDHGDDDADGDDGTLQQEDPLQEVTQKRTSWEEESTDWDSCWVSLVILIIVTHVNGWHWLLHLRCVL